MPPAQLLDLLPVTCFCRDIEFTAERRIQIRNRLVTDIHHLLDRKLRMMLSTHIERGRTLFYNSVRVPGPRSFVQRDRLHLQQLSSHEPEPPLSESQTCK